MKHLPLPEQPTADMIEAAYPLIEAMPVHTEGRRKRLAEAIYRAMWHAAPSPPQTGLTRRQKQVQQFLADYITDHGISPSTGEIAAALGMRQRSQAWIVLDALARKGVVRIGERGQARNVILEVYPGQPLPDR